MTSQHSASAEANHEGTGIECVTIDGVEISVTRRDLIEESFDDCIDPCFFEQDYTVAASTGFHIWEGCHIMIDQLQSGALNEMVKGRRVLELGAGTGLGGLCAAAIGAHVLLTDVPSVVWGMLNPNIARNTPSVPSDGLAKKAPLKGDPATLTATTSETGGGVPGAVQATSCTPWPSAVSVGRGTAAAVALDWTTPVSRVGALDPMEAEVILAAECIWLAELVPPFVSTVSTLLRGPNKPWCLLCYRDRAHDQSATFVHMESVVSAFKAAGCTVTRLSDHVVDRERDKGKSTDRNKRVVMYRVELAHK